MKSFYAVAGAALVGTSSAGWTSCSAKDYSLAMKGFFQGMQIDPMSFDTGCFDKITNMSDKWKTTNASFYHENYQVSDFMRPIYQIMEAQNSMTEVFVYCQTTNLAKQAANRFSTYGGMIDLATTIGVAFLKHYADPDRDSKLFQAGNSFLNATDCPRTARALGEMVHYSFFFEIEPTLYEDELPQNLAA